MTQTARIRSQHPLRADLTGLPPVLIQLAELDALRLEGEALAGRGYERSRRAGGGSKSYQGVLHGFLRATDGVPRRRAMR